MCENGIIYGLIISVVISILVFLIPFLYEKFRYYRFYKNCTREFVDPLIQNGKLDIYLLANYFGVDSVTVRFHLVRLGYCINSSWVYRAEND